MRTCRWRGTRRSTRARASSRSIWNVSCCRARSSTLNHLLEHEIDLSALDARYRNDATGASAYPPATLLKLVLFAYSQGIASSRAIERMCRDHAIFIVLSGDSQPHFTAIASFIRSLGNEIAKVFAQVLLICDRQGLIGREMFAIDGVKLPTNGASIR